MFKKTLVIFVWYRGWFILPNIYFGIICNKPILVRIPIYVYIYISPSGFHGSCHFQGFCVCCRCASRDRIPGGPYQASWSPLDLEAQTGWGLPFRRDAWTGVGWNKKSPEVSVGCFPKIGVFTPNHPNFNKVFHYKLLGETPLFLQTSGCFLSIIVVGCWFQLFFIFTPIWGRCPFLLIFFNWVETTNQYLNEDII